MKEHTFYHGTVTGKDDIFLESFAMTGALSGKSRDAWDQLSGLYVSIAPLHAKLFAHTCDKPREDGLDDQSALRVGRGMIVAITAKPNARVWDIDHEMSQGRSLELLRKMKDFLPKLDLSHAKYECWSFSWRTFGFDAVNTDDTGLHVTLKPLPRNGLKGEFLRSEREMDMRWPERGGGLGERNKAFVLDKLHGMLARQFPREYLAAKQETLDEMVESGAGYMKYTGRKPLVIDKIYLRPLDAPVIEDTETLDRWEVAYEGLTSRKGSKRKAAAAPVKTGIT